MAIQIETRKMVNSNGEQQREILKISGCLCRTDLPELYNNGEHRAFNDINTIRLKSNIADIGGVMLEVKFQASIAELKLCGNALRNAKKKLAEMKEAWNGEETFII